MPDRDGNGYEAELAFAEALRQLMEREELARISVTAIAKRAGYSRKTFYAYFHDKDELLKWVFYREFMRANGGRPIGGGWQALRAFADALQTDRTFFMRALRSSGEGSFSEYFSRLLTSAIYIGTADALERRVGAGRAVDMAVSNMAETVYRTLLAWLEDADDVPVETLMTFMEQSALAFADAARAQVDGSVDCGVGDTLA